MRARAWPSCAHTASSSQAALAPLGERAHTHRDIDALVRAIAANARAGDHIVCMSNGSFGGIHAKLLAALAARG